MTERRLRLRHLVESFKFNMLTGVVIILNMIFIGLESDFVEPLKISPESCPSAIMKIKVCHARAFRYNHRIGFSFSYRRIYIL